MPPQPEAVLKIETQWIREYARTYLPTEDGFSFSAELLRRKSISLVTIINVFRNGYVVFSDKLDGPGALWVVEGEDNDGDPYRITIVVLSESIDVTLREVEAMTMEVERATEVERFGCAEGGERR